MFSVLSPAAPVTVSQFILTQRDDSSLSVSWLAPRQRSRTSVEYEVMFFEKVRPALFVLPPFTQRGGSVLFVQWVFVTLPCLISAGRGGTLHSEAPS